VGGQVNLVARPDWKRGYTELVDYQSSQLSRSGVSLHLNNDVHAIDVVQQAPDAVIIATGAKPARIDIPGIDSKKVIQADEALLSEVGGNVVVIVGGGRNGCEIAVHLAAQGKKITIVDILPKIGTVKQLGFFTQQHILRNFQKFKVRLMPGIEVRRITEAGIIIVKQGKEELVPADAIVLATGVKSENELYNELRERILECYLIGDAVEPRTILEAVYDGFDVGLRL